MPCMGPSTSYSKKLAADLVEKLWPEYERAVEMNWNHYHLLDYVERYLKELMNVPPNHSGYNYVTHELTRYKYLAVGVLFTLLPNEEYEFQLHPEGAVGTGLRMSRLAVADLTKEKMTTHLKEAFYVPDFEDF